MTNAIAASAMRLRTLADGSLRIEVEVQPADAQAAFALFGRPGAPMALAALKEGYAAAGSEPVAPKPEEKPKGGLLSQWAAMRCQEPEFQYWLRANFWTVWEKAMKQTTDDTQRAAHVIRYVAAVKSRAELDSCQPAAERFHQHIRGPWQKHCIATGVTA